jgi:ATP:ADP antiporter, AAA family
METEQEIATPTGMLATAKSRLIRLLGVQEEDAAGVLLSATSAFCILACYYLIQPLSDAMALHIGVENTPWITVGNLILIIIANPLYAMLAKTLPPSRLLPVLYRFLGSVLVAFAAAFLLAPDNPSTSATASNSSMHAANSSSSSSIGGGTTTATASTSFTALVSFGFACFIGTFSLFLMSTFWARMASLHSKAEAKRVFGIIAAGAQSGQLISSLFAAFLFSALHESVALVSVCFIEAAVCIIARLEIPPDSTIHHQIPPDITRHQQIPPDTTISCELPPSPTISRSAS